MCIYGITKCWPVCMCVFGERVCKKWRGKF